MSDKTKPDQAYIMQDSWLSLMLSTVGLCAFNLLLGSIWLKGSVEEFFYSTILLTIGFFVVIHAQEFLPEKPSKETSIYDGASLLSGTEKASLEQKLINYADTTSTQIVVATITSLEGHNINLYASQWAHKWGIGQADKDNGILFLVAKDDRKMAIQVGYGLEHLKATFNH